MEITMSSEEEVICPCQPKNPHSHPCPFVKDIRETRDTSRENKNNIGWLKKGYWVQALISISILIPVLVMAIKFVSG